VQLKDVRAYDTRGRKQGEEWAKALTSEALVLLEFRDGDVDGRQLAEAFRLYRQDLYVLVLPTAVWTGLDTSRAFAPTKSLPQAFPGSKAVPGAPVPPIRQPGM
jgi:hypothetical protein